jgi:hypothetical protein
MQLGYLFAFKTGERQVISGIFYCAVGEILRYFATLFAKL